jgi:hypothetical protein
MREREKTRKEKNNIYIAKSPWEILSSLLSCWHVSKHIRKSLTSSSGAEAAVAEAADEVSAKTTRNC